MSIELRRAESRVSYNYKEGRYVIDRIYGAQGCSPENVIGLEYDGTEIADGGPSGDFIPRAVVIRHLSDWCGGSGDDSDAEAVTCYAIDREAYIQDGGTLTDTMLHVTYQGFVLGPRYWEERVYTGSEPIQASLDDPPKQIGADAEGVSVERPRMEMIIVENALGAQVMYGGKKQLIEELTGTVNQAGWDPDVTEETLPYPEGTWLYMGADIQDHPGYYYTISHRFLQIPWYCQCGFDWGGSGIDQHHDWGSSSIETLCNNPLMHIYRYRPYHEYGSGTYFEGAYYQLVRRKWMNEVACKVYCIAGTDTFHDFDDLNL